MFHPALDLALRDLKCCECGQVGVHGLVYDVTNFFSTHPGGEVLLRAVQGTDITSLFETSHLNSKIACETLSKLPVVAKYQQHQILDYDAYRKIREQVFRMYPTRGSRRMVTRARLLMWMWIMISVVTHAVLLSGVMWSFSCSWVFVCIVYSLSNSVCGGYGHNAVHRLEVESILLDWNGLSCFEWLLEHVISHHPHVNTKNDHDAISMEPFLRWIPSRPVACFGDAQTSYASHLIYAIAEIAVAIQGVFAHRLRWRAAEFGAPSWMRMAPLLFVFRISSFFVCLPLVDATACILGPLALASYYFATLAHVSHREVSVSSDFLNHQLQNTQDIRLKGSMGLFLDRQKLHHLFPTIDHTTLK